MMCKLIDLLGSALTDGDCTNGGILGFFRGLEASNGEGEEGT